MDPHILDAIEVTIKICTAITLITSIANIIATLVSRAKAPEIRQNERIAELEARITKMEERTAEIEDRSDQHDGANKIVLQSLLALMRHAIDGNNIETLKKAEHDLDNYLVQK